jgi:hypothetical protein
MGVALAALVIAGSAGAYASVSASSNSVHACVRHRGGVLYVAKKCASHDRKVTWSVAGPPGPGGAAGPQGPAGAPDISQFYTKTDSDARFVHGGGALTAIPVLDVPNAAGGTLVSIAGVGELDVQGCGLGDTLFKYTNKSSATENYALIDAYAARNDPGGDPYAGSLPTSGTFSPYGDAHDLIQFTLSNGTQTVQLVIGETVAADDDCLYWGDISTT